jgi:hypothetical protein
VPAQRLTKGKTIEQRLDLRHDTLLSVAVPSLSSQR